MLTSYAEDELLFDAIAAGAAGYVLKQIGSGELVRALEEPSRYFHAAQLLDHRIGTGLHPARQQPDQEDQPGDYHQPAQRPRTADVAAVRRWLEVRRHDLRLAFPEGVAQA